MSRFRDKIVAELSRSRFAAGYHTPEEIVAQATKLGVLPETLTEACFLRRERSVTTGLQTLTPIEYFATHRKKLQEQSHNARILSMFINPPVLALIEGEAERRQIERGKFIRGVVQHFLLENKDPPALYPSWAEIVDDVKGGKTVNLTYVSFAAAWVMTFHAERLRCTFNTLLRTIIINTLRGHFARHGEIVYPHSPRGMPQNIHEYPGFSEEELDRIADNMQTDVCEPVWKRRGLTGEKRVGRGMRLPDGGQLKVYKKGPYNLKKKQVAEEE